eukprot:498234-Alexandrium_andersonii.AAC.1
MHAFARVRRGEDSKRVGTLLSECVSRASLALARTAVARVRPSAAALAHGVLGKQAVRVQGTSTNTRGHRKCRDPPSCPARILSFMTCCAVAFKPNSLGTRASPRGSIGNVAQGAPACACLDMSKDLSISRRASHAQWPPTAPRSQRSARAPGPAGGWLFVKGACLLYTSDAADDM